MKTLIMIGAAVVAAVLGVGVCACSDDDEYFSNSNTSVSSPTGFINGHEYVDLGLSVKWATCNVGAYFPDEYGDYYAWGETSTKTEYTEENSEAYHVNLGSSIAGDPQYDAARANWGGTWRLPTLDEIRELKDKCTWTWIIKGDHNGYKVTGPNGNSIFLPAAGLRSGTSLDRVGERGFYWSATSLYRSMPGLAGRLVFSNDTINWNSRSRYLGQSVRPVSK